MFSLASVLYQLVSVHTRKACISGYYEIFYVAILFDILSIKGTSLLNGKCRACVGDSNDYIKMTPKHNLKKGINSFFTHLLWVVELWEIFIKSSVFLIFNYDYFYNLKMLLKSKSGRIFL